MPLSTTSTIPLAKPLLKWAGGKTQLLPDLINALPAEIGLNTIQRYVEPFIGGAAFFLHLAQHYKIHQFYLFDSNPELILLYQTVQREPHALIQALTHLTNDFIALPPEKRKIFFYEIRQQYNQQQLKFNYSDYSTAWIERGTYLIFLNHTCFNGLFRVNRKGAFNVPFGDYKNPRIYDAQNILQVHELLKQAVIQQADFTACLPYINRHSFVYFDPPYRPLNTTSNFTAYCHSGFDDNEQKRLAHFFTQLHEKTGAKLMLSNADPQNTDLNDTFFEKLYGNFHIQRVKARRMINANGNKRGYINELLITNYPPLR